MKKKSIKSTIPILSNTELHEILCAKASFTGACLLVIDKLKKLDKKCHTEYAECNEFTISEDDKEVICRGEKTIRNESVEYYATFPIQLLTYSDDDLDIYINNRITELKEK